MGMACRAPTWRSTYRKFQPNDTLPLTVLITICKHRMASHVLDKG